MRRQRSEHQVAPSRVARVPTRCLPTNQVLMWRMPSSTCLHRAHSHLDKGSGTVRILFLDFSSTFTLLRDKLSRMGVDPQLMDWISDYLTGRPQYVGLKDITSDTVVSSTGAPQGTVLAPLLFTLYTSDFCYNSELCHIQKYA
ncbi:hypothetical protein L3Q82_000888 [Scortum barcoo]|uniref:Uncharacterized protein n=1 Tax=Scortum barcoo TaxID=214431 RepID=A0ACB8WBT0_9TELE|nr:hypothetical protein L3Q82_000888 [Scortum barcoo]